MTQYVIGTEGRFFRTATPLHTVWHFGKLYQWFRRMDGVHVMRPADKGAPDAEHYQVGIR